MRSRPRQYVDLAVAQGAAGLRALSLTGRPRIFATVALSVWLFALLGDALTTHIAISAGIGEEANPGADFFFRLVGVEVWSFFGAAVIAVLALPTLARPLHRVIIPLQAGLAVVLLVKLTLVLNNSLVIWGYPAITA